MARSKWPTFVQQPHITIHVLSGRTHNSIAMQSKKTLVLGASTNTDRVSCEAMLRLQKAGHEVVAVGVREGEIYGIPIKTGTPAIEELDTVTLYLNPERQKGYYQYILGLHPKRIIFNPGTENTELLQMARAAGISTEIACTLVMLSLKIY